MLKKLLLGALLLAGTLLHGQTTVRTFAAQETANTFQQLQTMSGGAAIGGTVFDTLGRLTTPLNCATAPGTPCFQVANTTLIPNLNAALLQNCNWASPCALGTLIPNSVFGTDAHFSSVTVTGAGGVNAQSRWFSITVTNSGSAPGSWTNQIAKLDGNGNAIPATTADSNGLIGICVSGCSNSGQAEIAILGITSCTVDNAVSNSDWLIEGTVTGGTCRDAGATRPSSGQVVGRALSAQPTPGSLVTVMVNPDAVGSANSQTYALNGILYGNGSTSVQVTSAGGGGTLCLIETNGGTPVFGSCAGSASTVWSALSNPAGNLSLGMGNNTSLFTFGAATGAATDMWKIADTTSNTGTGFAFHVSLASGSAAKPAAFDINGNGVSITNAGVLQPLGTGHIVADQTSRTINTTSPLSGGGLFNADLTLTCPTCVTSGSSMGNHGVVLGSGAQGVHTVAPPASSGLCWVSQGPGADPIWTNCLSGSGSGSVTNNEGSLVAGNPTYGFGANDLYSSPTVYEVSQFAGADECAKINAAITAATAASQQGAVIDARGLVGAQTCGSQPFLTETRTVVRAKTSQNFTLLLGCNLTLTTNVQIQVPSSANSILGCNSFGSNSAQSTQIIAGASFPTSGCTTDANGICAILILGSADKPAENVNLSHVYLNGNSKANVWGIYTSQLHDRSRIEDVHIVNVGTTASPGGCILVDKTFGQSVTGGDTGASNYVITNVECDPAASGATASFEGIYVRMNASGTGGPAEISNVYFYGKGNSTCGSGSQPCQTMESGVKVSGGTWGHIRHVHCEFTVDCVQVGNTTDNVNTAGLSVADVSIASVGNNTTKGIAVHMSTKAVGSLALSLNAIADANTCAVKDDISSVTICNKAQQAAWFTGGTVDVGTGVGFGAGATDTAFCRTGAGALQLGAAVCDNTGQLDLTTLLLEGKATTYLGQATDSGGLVADYKATASGAVSAAIGQSSIMTIPNNGSFGGVWFALVYINVSHACTTNCTSATVAPQIVFTDNDINSSFTITGPTCSLVAVGVCSTVIPIFPKINTAVFYKSTIAGSSPSGYTYQLRTRLIKP